MKPLHLADLQYASCSRSMADWGNLRAEVLQAKGPQEQAALILEDRDMLGLTDSQMREYLSHFEPNLRRAVQQLAGT